MLVEVFAGVGGLPLFNPDLEAVLPAPIALLREKVAMCDMLLIASPEYAHGIAAPMKNVLDWLVSFDGSVNKPVAVVNTSPRAHHAHEALVEVLRTMNLDLVPDACINLPLLGQCAHEDQMLETASIRQGISTLLGALDQHLQGSGSAGPSFALG